ncbi:MAG: SpoIIE family protein phosphatase [Acidobacteriota bacterium]|nr:SpoIIE family protein phosphatase [Acidobacteriota bacterium]
MKTAALLALSLVLPACTGLRAQTFSLQTQREPVTSLDGLWRFHTGDNPAWADPNFDDSAWPLLRSDQSWTAQGYPDYTGMAWYRFSVELPSDPEQLSLALPHIITNYEVYADGALIGTYGKMPSGPAYAGGGRFRGYYSIPLASTHRDKVTIAIRVWQWPGWTMYNPGGPAEGGALIGSTALIQQQQALWRAVLQWGLAGTGMLIAFQTLAGLCALFLFAMRRSEREYLWFSLIMLFAIGSESGTLFMSLHPLPTMVATKVVESLGESCVGLAEIAFYRTLLKGKRTPLYLAAVIGLSLTLVLNFVQPFFSNPHIAGFRMARDSMMLPLYVWMLSLLFTRARQNFLDARLLIAPVVMQKAALVFQQGADLLANLGLQHTLGYHALLFEHPVPVELLAAANGLFLLAMLAILIHRFTRTRSQEERFASEVLAARNVQQFLIPVHLPQTPGLAIESEYRPAREVGGDFFQVLPNTTDGSALIVVGDVAGKGMEAGMLATLIVGAIRTAASFTTDPGKIIALLNERMLGRGLATCLALRIEKDGAAALANAGHLPPYLNGQELPIEGALPLGAVPGIDFPVLNFKFAQGDSLMLMTDGVAEAQDAEGHLFGFDRIAELLEQGMAAAALASAAQTFGQEDDITVLTVARLTALA